jgi:hypothetical protein
MAPLKNITIQESLGFESLTCVIFTEIIQTYNSNNITINWNNIIGQKARDITIQLSERFRDYLSRSLLLREVLEIKKNSAFQNLLLPGTTKRQCTFPKNKK